MTALPDARPRTYAGAHLRLPDERARLRAARPACSRTRATSRADATGTTPTSSCFNTCAVRENADNKLYGNLGHLAPVRPRDPGMQIAVGGCLAQKDRGEITRRAPVGRRRLRHPQHRLAAGAARAGAGRNDEAQVEILESLEVFPSTLPTRRESAYAAWVSISVGLQQHLHVLHRAVAARHARRTAGPGDVLAEVEALVGRGRHRGHAARPERQLLRRRVRRPAGVRQAAARVRRDRRASSGSASPVAAPARLHRRRDRGDGRDAERDAAAAHAAAVRLRRGAQGDAAVVPPGDGTSASSTGCAPRCPTPPSPPTSSSASRARPRPTSSETLDVVARGAVRRRLHVPVLQAPRHAGGRPGRPGAQATSCRSATSGSSRSSDEIAWDENKRLVGRDVELLVAEGEGRKDGATHRLSGRARDNRLVHFAPDAAVARSRARRHGRGRGHLRRTAPPGRRRCCAVRTAHPRR